jgi:hypothetical protein
MYLGASKRRRQRINSRKNVSHLFIGAILDNLHAELIGTELLCLGGDFLNPWVTRPVSEICSMSEFSV